MSQNPVFLCVLEIACSFISISPQSMLADTKLTIMLMLVTVTSYQVDYQEKQFAQGLIPSTYMRREGAPKERELLCGRIIDRPIRPLFPAGFYHEVQVVGC